MWLLAVLFLIVVLFCFDDSIVVDEVVIPSDKVEETVKLAVVSDFHCGNAEEVLAHLEQIDPDAILIPGDLIDENRKLSSIEELCQGLRRWPVYFASGNHEFKIGRVYQDYNQLISILEENQLVHLENECCKVKLNQQEIYIGGIQDHTSDKTKNPDELDDENLRQVYSKMDESYFRIMLMHRPEQVELIEKYGVELYVSGHAHGGQWRFPKVNGLFAPQQGFFPKRAGGLYLTPKGFHLVSRGLGKYWYLPRILNHREINVITIKRAD